VTSISKKLALASAFLALTVAQGALAQTPELVCSLTYAQAEHAARCRDAGISRAVANRQDCQGVSEIIPDQGLARMLCARNAIMLDHAYEHPESTARQIFHWFHQEADCDAYLLTKSHAKAKVEVIQAMRRRAGLVTTRLVKARDRGVSLAAAQHEIENPPTAEEPEGMAFALRTARFAWEHPQMDVSEVLARSYADCVQVMTETAKRYPDVFEEYAPIRSEDEWPTGEVLQK
jgi:hypothetical protein